MIQNSIYIKSTGTQHSYKNLDRDLKYHMHPAYTTLKNIKIQNSCRVPIIILLACEVKLEHAF